MRENQILKGYEYAKEQYAAYGIDVDQVVARFDQIPVSIPCWQGDDVGGFERNAGGVSGGILATGNYPGKPRTVEELRSDMTRAMAYIPGSVKINLHSSYGEGYEPSVDRDERICTPPLCWMGQVGQGKERRP